MKKKRKRHSPEQIVKKLRDAEVMLSTGKSLEEVLKMLEVSEATLQSLAKSVRRNEERGSQEAERSRRRECSIETAAGGSRT